MLACSIHGLGCVIERPNLKALHSSTPAAIPELPVFFVCQHRTDECFGQSSYFRDGFISPVPPSAELPSCAGEMEGS